MKLNKFATVIATCGLLATTGTLFTSKANAATDPPKTPQAGDAMSFQTTVAKECSVSADGGSEALGPTTSIAYTEGYTTVAAVGETPNPEKRVNNLTATDTVTFNCNTDTVALVVNLGTLIAPNSFSNAQNLDLKTGAGDTGVDHTVSINYSPVNATDLTATPVLATGDVVNNTTFPTDLEGNIKVDLTDTFTAGGEELAAGDYKTEYSITVTAN